MLKIKRNSNTNKITVGLTSNTNLNGLSESNESYYLQELESSINTPVDEEISIFKSLRNLTYSFVFLPNNNTLTGQGFTLDEIREPSEGVQRSFFFYQVFTTSNIYNQNLLFTNYYNGFDFFSNGNTTAYQLGDNIFSNINIRNNQLYDVINNKLYLRFYFFNGKTGEINTFINREKESDTTTSKLFHEITLNTNNNTYDFTTIFNNVSIRMIETDNSEYANKINNNQQKQLNQKPETPQGEGFNDDGTYINF